MLLSSSSSPSSSSSSSSLSFSGLSSLLTQDPLPPLQVTLCIYNYRPNVPDTFTKACPMASTGITSASQEISTSFDKLLKDVTANLSPEERKDAVSSIKATFKGKFNTEDDQDLYSCLYLLANQGVFSEDNLTLLEKFVVTPHTSKKTTIQAKIHNFKAVRPLQESRKQELTGRNRDLTNVISMLTTDRSSVVNLYGSSGVGKTRLATEAFSQWSGPKFKVDLREVDKMKDVHFQVFLALSERPGQVEGNHDYEANRVIAKMEHVKRKSEGDILLFLDNADKFVGATNELNASFGSFLDRLLSNPSGKTTQTKLKILLTSRGAIRHSISLKVENHELRALERESPDQMLQKSAPVEFYGIPLKDDILLDAPARIVIAACRGKMDKDRYEDFCKQCDYQGERGVLRSFFEFLAGLTLENQQSCFEAIVRKLRNQGNLDHIIQRLEKAPDTDYDDDDDDISDENDIEAGGAVGNNDDDVDDDDEVCHEEDKKEEAEDKEVFKEGMEDSGNEEENGEGGVQAGEVDTHAQWDYEKDNTDGEFGEEMTQTTVQDVNQEMHSLQLEEQAEKIAEHPLKTTIFEGVVTSEGIHLDLYRWGVHLTFPPGSVTESTTIMVHRWEYGACLPTLGEHEAVVSNVIEISTNKEVKALEFEDEVKLALSHSAPDLEGYELVVKKLLDAETNEWDEVDGCENIRGISGFSFSDIEDDYPTTDKVPNFLFAVVQAGILECSTYAVVSRLKVSPTYTITVNGGTFGHPDYPQVAITVPKKAVGTKTKLSLQLKVQEVPQDEFQDLHLFAGPILHISDSSKAEFLKPVTVQLPVCLREKTPTIPNPSMWRARIFYLRSETESKEWIEISSELDNPATYDGKVVRFQVRRFSGYACFLDWCGDDLRSKTYDIIDYLWSIVRNQPLEASFFAYFDPKKRRHYQGVLHLICCPAHLRKEVKEEILDEFGKEGNCMSEVSSKRLMIPERDKAFVSVSGGINTLEDTEDFYLRFNGKTKIRDQLDVRVTDLQAHAEVEFRSTPEKNVLNNLHTLSTLSIDVQKTPVEFFGLPFDDPTLHDAPFQGSIGILTACKGALYNIGQGRIYLDHVDLASKLSEREVKKSLLMELSKLDPEHKQRCFDEIVSTLEKGGEGLKHIRNRLIEAHEKIDAPVNERVWDLVADRFKDRGAYWKNLARGLQPKIPESDIFDAQKDGEGAAKECCRVVLQKWYQRHQSSATSKELMRCLTNMGLANANWQIMKELGLVNLENIPLSER
ncbi:uncharacterized protein [Acropora muricata]|uniref:uncharacterized protein isoform X2 n=1 Tax=Acropora muricata TaxID=159855 RepID=UPI0034E43D98